MRPAPVSLEREQNHPDTPAHLFLLPLAASPVRLLTHTVDATLRIEGNQPIVSVKAGYRLHNTGKENLSALLQIVPNPPGTSRPLPEAISLTVDGQPLSLQPTGDGAQQTTQVSLPPDGRRLLVLTYQMRLVESELPALRYPVEALAGWQGVPESWRITVTLPGEGSGVLPAESWVATAPEDWRYDGSQLQWLDEGSLPTEPITLQFIHPGLWNELSETRRSLNAQPLLDGFLHLGNLYTRLYRSPHASEGSRLRFYAQALAAYADGVTYGEQADAVASDLAPLHQALASLYRSRSIAADGSVDAAYVELMVGEAEKAFAAFPTADGRRDEVAQWLVEGLKMQFQHTRQTGDWQRAIHFLDRMADLPSTLVDPAWIDAERQTVQLQQALNWLNQDNQEAALALVGADILDETLLPRAENRALFAGWQITLTIQPDTVTLDAVARPVDGRETVAQQTFDQLVQAWQSVQTPGIQTGVLPDGRISIHLLDTGLDERTALVQAMPDMIDWALLRTVLVNVDPAIQRSHRSIWQEVEMAQEIDLRPVVDQWRGIAAILEREAAREQITPVATNAADHSIQQEIRSQLRQIYHQQEAGTWRETVRSSSVRVHMQTAVPVQATSRTWIIQLSDPPQTLTFHTEVLNTARLLLSVISLLILILALASVLWLLL